MRRLAGLVNEFDRLRWSSSADLQDDAVHPGGPSHARESLVEMATIAHGWKNCANRWGRDAAGQPLRLEVSPDPLRAVAGLID